MATKRSRSGGKGTVAKTADRDLEVWAEKVVAALPGAGVTWKFHNASFDTGGKVFGFTRDGGMVMKLPETRVGELVDGSEAAVLVMGTRAMRQWVIIPQRDAATLELLREACAFVESLR